MRIMSYAKLFLAVSVVALAVSACSSLVTINERAVTVQDIINMTKAEVGPDIIKRHIEVTRSQFMLDPDQIVRLKEAGVNDRVIKAMLDTDEAAELVDLEKSYSLYDYWFNYYNTNYPVNLYSYPVYPILNFSWDQGPYSSYRWSGESGRYYRDFPVGLPRIPAQYPLHAPRALEPGETPIDRKGAKPQK